MTVKQLLNVINIIADPNLASEWDNVGLQVGNPENNITKILLGMDVTADILDHAASNGFNTIIVHHPLIFKPVKSIDCGTSLGNLLSKAISLKLNIISAHTNLDHVDWGVSQVLAEYLGLQNLRPVKCLDANYMFKLAVFVPEEALDKVRSAICDAGGGVIGDYRYCTFSTPGKGTFLGGESAKPYIGETGQLEQVDEYRLEVLVEKNVLSSAIKAMVEAHPYEEVAYDIYPLSNIKDYGVGRIGIYDKPKKVSDISSLLKSSKWVSCLGLIGDKSMEVKKVAVCGGAAGSIIDSVISSGAELLVCGELGYHTELTAAEKKLNVILLGHGQSEIFVLDALKKKLQSYIKDADCQVYEKVYSGPRWEYFDGKH